MTKIERYWLFFGGYILLLVIALLPICLTNTLPLSDYSNHLARMYILMHETDSAVLHQYYEIHWAILPNLAMEIVVPMLATWFPLEVAGKVFVALIFLLISSGTVALHYSIHRKLSVWPFLSFLFLYNSMLILGVMNYLFSLGCSLWVLAAWVYLRDRPYWLRFSFFYTVAVLLFFAHLSAFGFYAVVVSVYELYWFIKPFRPRGWRIFLDFSCVFGQFVIPVCLFLFSQTKRSVSLTSYWEFFRKVLAPYSLFYNYNYILDLITFIAVIELLILGFISRRLVIDRSMRLAVFCMIMAFFAMPSTLLSSNYADYRLIPAVAFLFIAASDYRVTGVNWRFVSFIIFGLAAIFVFRVSVIYKQWFEIDKKYDEYFQAIDRMPIGSRLFSIFIQGEDGKYNSGASKYFNAESVPSYAVIRRSAFVPIIFADIHVVPISFTPAYAKLAAEMPGSYFSGGKGAYLSADSILDWSKLKRHYDFFLIGHEASLRFSLPSGIEKTFTGRDFILYRVVRS